MTIDPVVPVAVLVIVAVFLVGASIASVVRGTPPVDGVLRGLAAILLVLVALRPAIPAAEAGATVSGGLEVYFAVDTTSSMAAEDATADQTDAVPARRLDAAKADIHRIADALQGAQFSLVTFDAATVQRVPLTADASALGTAVDTLTQEVTSYSRGSAIDEAVPDLEKILGAAKTAAPGDTRVLFYLGDGEQTSSAPVGSFASLAPLISGGGVLGYGTDAGGIMQSFSGYSTDGPSNTYITDPTTGSAAVSRIDETALQTIADQLGVAYTHRTTAAGIADVVRGLDVGELTIAPGRIAEPVELYWIPAVPLAIILLVELVRLARPLREAFGGRA